MRSATWWTPGFASPHSKPPSRNDAPRPVSCTTRIEGVQYASRAYRERLEAHGIRGSMARRGSPYDNAHVESFFKTLKYEEVFAFDYRTVEDVVVRRLPYFLEEI